MLLSDWRFIMLAGSNQRDCEYLLKGMWIRKRGFYHDGRFATLPDVVNHYNSFRKLKLTEAESDLVEYLKSI